MIRKNWTVAALAQGTFRLLVALAVLPGSDVVFATEHKVPAARPPAGIAIALLGPGVDYRAPELIGRLARDGEGELIAQDFADGDLRPFEATGTVGTERARVLAGRAPGVRLVIIKEKPRDPQAFGHMMSFVARTPARVVVWPDADPERPDWPILLEAVRRFPGHLFLFPRPAATDASGLADLDKAANVVMCLPRTPSLTMECLAEAAAAAAEQLATVPPPAPGRIRELIFEKIAAEPPAAPRP